MIEAQNCAMVLTAIEVEYEAVRAHLTNLTQVRHQSGTFYERGFFQGKDQTWSVSIAQPGAHNERDQPL
jgi:nucleoside 2-deoxyribosyltransferase